MTEKQEQQREKLIADAKARPGVAEAVRIFELSQPYIPQPQYSTQVTYSTRTS